MGRFEPGVMCLTHSLVHPGANGKVVELICRIHPPYPSRYLFWWHCRSLSTVWSDYPTRGWVPPGTDLAVAQRHLTPLNGPDLGITEEDVKELYAPADRASTKEPISASNPFGPPRKQTS